MGFYIQSSLFLDYKCIWLVSWNATHSIVICLTIVHILGRLKIVESLELILAPRLHWVSNRTTLFRVLIPVDTSGGWDGINIVSMISSVLYLLELIVRTFLLRAMCSNRVILMYIRTAGGCFRRVGSGQLCLIELYSCNEWNGQWCFKW